MPHRRPVRVLQAVGRMDRAGTETLLMRVLRHIDRTQVRMDFLVRNGSGGDYEREILSLGSRIYECPHTGGPVSFRRGLDRILRASGPFDAVHSHLHFFDGLVMACAARAGVPVRISHSHRASGAASGGLVRRGWNSLMRRLILRHATHRIGASEDAYRALFGAPCRHDAASRLFPNAIDLAVFGPAAPWRDRRACGLPGDGFLAGHVGRFCREKNHLFLLECFAALLRRMAGARLVLAGDGPLRAEVARRAEALRIAHRVHFAGVRGDVPQLLRHFGVFLFPSLSEGLGIAVLEAQAAGLPCLVSTAVPREADLGLGLLRRNSLQQGAEAWAEDALEWSRTCCPLPWSDRRLAIARNGYDVEESVKEWMRLYGAPADPVDSLPAAAGRPALCGSV